MCTPVSLLPDCVDDVSSAECDVDLLVAVVVVEAAVTVVVSGSTAQIIRHLLPKGLL